MQHVPNRSNNTIVLPFNHPILLRVMRCYQLSSNAFWCTKVFKLIRHILSIVITFESVNVSTNIFLGKCFKFTKLCERLIFLLHGENPTHTRKIINKYNIILMLGCGCYREQSTHIWVNSIKDHLHSTIFIMKGIFSVLPQCTPFACVSLL